MLLANNNTVLYREIIYRAYLKHGTDARSVFGFLPLVGLQ